MSRSHMALEMKHDRDPKEVLLEAFKGRLEGIEPLGALVLVGVYQRPEQLASGLFVPGKTREEDKFQGKVGVVLKLGPLAFTEDMSHTWGDVVPRVGDWVAFRVADAWPALVGDQMVRFVEDVAIKAILTHPDLVY